MVSTGSVAPWVAAGDIGADPRLAGISLPTGVTLAMCCQAATDFLYKSSGRRYTTRQDTFRPVRISPGCECLDFDLCDCRFGNEYVFPHPVVSISSVTVDGGALAAGSDYVLYDHRRLVRLTVPPSGRTPYWPCCQRLSWPITQVGTWSVTAVHGVAPPDGGVLAARELAIQLALYFGGKTQLPMRTRTVTRQGVSITISDPATPKDNRTGIPVVDWFLQSENPDGRARRPVVMSPDTIASPVLT